MDYKKYITSQDMEQRGYDLKAEGNLDQFDFHTMDEAIDDFLQQCFDGLYDFIESERGPLWTERFFNDMAEEIDPIKFPGAYRKQQALKWSILEQCVFIYDNGDALTRAFKTTDYHSIAPKVVRKLWNNKIIGM